MIVLTAPFHTIDRVEFSPDGNLLAVGCLGVLDTYSLAAPERPLARLSAKGPVRSFRFTRGGLVVGSVTKGVAAFWRVPDAEPTELIAVAADGSRLYFGTGSHSTPDSQMYDDRGRTKPRPLWSSSPPTDFMPAHGIGFLPGDARVFTVEGYYQFRVRVRDAATGKVTATVPVPAPSVMLVAAHPHADELALAVPGAILLLRLDDPDRSRWVENPVRTNFTGVAFHPSGRFLAATNQDETVRVFRTDTGDLAASYDWRVGRLGCLAFSPDGTLVAAGSETGNVVVWDFDG